jgi:hypothetical protein
MHQQRATLFVNRCICICPNQLSQFVPVSIYRTAPGHSGRRSDRKRIVTSAGAGVSDDHCRGRGAAAGRPRPGGRRVPRLRAPLRRALPDHKRKAEVRAITSRILAYSYCRLRVLSATRMIGIVDGGSVVLYPRDRNSGYKPHARPFPSLWS